MTWDAVWKYALCCIAAYLLGSVSSGILISRSRGHNIRAEGSKNTGASNVLRSVGVVEGLLTFVCDFAKAAAAVWIGRALLGQWGAMAAGIFVVIGHNWPLFFEFRGGKGIACSVAVLLFTYTWQGAAAIGLCLLLILITRYISLGSLSLLTAFAVLVALTEGIWPAGAWAILLALLGYWRHRGNIRRILDGTEHRLTFKKKNPPTPQR